MVVPDPGKPGHLNFYPEHEGAVTAVGVSEDGLKVLTGKINLGTILLSMLFSL